MGWTRTDLIIGRTHPLEFGIFEIDQIAYELPSVSLIENAVVRSEYPPGMRTKSRLSPAGCALRWTGVKHGLPFESRGVAVIWTRLSTLAGTSISFPGRRPASRRHFVGIDGPYRFDTVRVSLARTQRLTVAGRPGDCGYGCAVGCRKGGCSPVYIGQPNVLCLSWKYWELADSEIGRGHNPQSDAWTRLQRVDQSLIGIIDCGVWNGRVTRRIANGQQFRGSLCSSAGYCRIEGDIINDRAIIVAVTIALGMDGSPGHLA